MTTSRINMGKSTEPRSFYVKTPLGLLHIYSKTSEDNAANFPGVYIELTEKVGDYGELLACVEYESYYKRLQTCVYQPSSEEPVTVIAHETSISMTGRTAIFDTHGGDSQLNERTGSKVLVIRPLTEAEADIADVGNMYRIRFDDGFETDAFEDELTIYE